MDDYKMPPNPEWSFGAGVPHATDDGANELDSYPNAEFLDYLNQLPHTLLDMGQDAHNHFRNTPTFPENKSNEDTYQYPTPPQTGALPNGTHFPTGTKSPRSEDNGEHESAKRPRLSLFGGDRVDEDEGDGKTQHEYLPPAPGHTIQQLSALSIGQEKRHESKENEVDVAPEQLNQENGTSQVPQSPELDNLSETDVPPIESPVPSEDSFFIPPDGQEPYELRKNINRTRTSTWVDADCSGNYDPEVEAKQRAQNQRLARASKKKRKERAKKKPVRKCIVRLRIRAMGTVRNITEDNQNWPDGWSDTNPDVAVDSQRDDQCGDFYRDKTPDIEPQVPIPDPTGELNDLTGHPSARGCQLCYISEEKCTMIDGGTWPCKLCSRNGLDCRLIMRPTIRGGRCKACNENGEDYCSFEDGEEYLEDGNRQIHCIQCIEEQRGCEMDIPEGYTHERADISEIMYGPDRAFAACTHCRESKQKCSLKKKADKPPCKQCKKNGVGCTFYELSKNADKTSKKKAVSHGGGTEAGTLGVYAPGWDSFCKEDIDAIMEEGNEPHDDPVTEEEEFEMEDAQGRRGVLTTHNTCFAHPIKFSINSENQASDCNFCAMPAFGFVGHFEREVHVMRWHNGLGFTEMGGGHCEYRGPTTMCINCVLERCQIIGCSDHHLQPLYEEASDLDFEQTFDELLVVPAGSIKMHHELKRWCSMCFSPALFKCSSIQASLFLVDEQEQIVDGCGLRLCGRCEKRLREEFEGDCSAMARALDLEPKAKENENGMPGMARADVGFLISDGLLLRNVQDGME